MKKRQPTLNIGKPCSSAIMRVRHLILPPIGGAFGLIPKISFIVSKIKVDMKLTFIRKENETIRVAFFGRLWPLVKRRKILKPDLSQRLNWGDFKTLEI